MRLRSFPLVICTIGNCLCHCLQLLACGRPYLSEWYRVVCVVVVVDAVRMRGAQWLVWLLRHTCMRWLSSRHTHTQLVYIKRTTKATKTMPKSNEAWHVRKLCAFQQRVGVEGKATYGWRKWTALNDALPAAAKFYAATTRKNQRAFVCLFVWVWSDD